MIRRLSRSHSIRGFRHDENGTATISFVLWIPFVLSLLLTFTDLTFILYKRSDIVRMVEDTNRMRAIGHYTTNDEAERALLTAMGYDPDVLTATPIAGLSVATSISSGVLATVVQVPMSEIDAFGVLTGMSGNLPVVVDLRQTIENWET